MLDEAEQQRVTDVGQLCPALRAWIGDVYAHPRVCRDVARGDPFPGGGNADMPADPGRCPGIDRSVTARPRS